MDSLSSIKKSVAVELESFDKRFSESLKTNIPLLNAITRYMLRIKGKQIRPLLLFLSAKMIGKVDEKTYIAAQLVELLHTATLIHDDVVDDSNERRGIFSIKALWKSKIAVLIGDSLLAKGLIISVKNNAYEILEIMTEAVEEMSEGEILQILKSRKLNITEGEYFDIIRKKTASLIAACTTCGARSVTNDNIIIKKMHEFGLNVGIAFQIKDDLLDYAQSRFTGKPKGNDLKEKKLTLPLIRALEQSDKKLGREIIRLINQKNNSYDTYLKVLDFINKNDGIEYSAKKMHEYKNSAMNILHDFPESESRDSLFSLINYIVDRKR